jgi:hypothetical protein
MRPLKFLSRYWIVAFCVLLSATASAQTDVDAIMMNKNVLCAGAMYTHNSWKDYWEGTFKRDNGNIGTITTQTYSVMGNYGISNKLNLLFNVPYVSTKASAGTLHGMKGFQDAALMLKWMPFLWHFGKKAIFSVYGVGGVSTPLTNYVADFLPLSIGLHSTNLAIRPMADLQYGHFFVTTSAVYMVRSNISIDRNSYYTTEMHYSNKVSMPDVFGYNGRIGYRSDAWIAEGVIEGMNTLGGFDIRKNDMPFPSNNMDATMVGVNFKYSLSAVPGLELTAGGRYTIAGRNMGQATIINGGVFYIMNFNKKKAQSTDQDKN